MANIGNGLPYIPTGFRFEGPIEEGDIVWYAQASVSIAAGDTVHQVAGYASNASYTQFDTSFLGIALFAQDNSAGALGAVSIAVIKPNPNKFFWVAVGSATLVTQAAVGTAVDLKTVNTVDITDTTNSYWLFEIVDFDASTLAVAANAAGFVKGKFQHQ